MNPTQTQPIKPITPTVNGQTFAQASQGITDRGQLGALAQQFQNASITNAATQPKINPTVIGTQPKNIPSPYVNTAQNNLQTMVDTTFTGSQTQNKDGTITTTFSDGTVNIPQTPDQQRQGFAQTLKDTFAKLGTKTTRTNEIQQEEGVQAKQTELRNIENEALALDNSFNKRVAKLLGEGGMTREQAAPQVQELERMQNSQKADLAIRQRVAQGNYTDAFNIAQAKVEAEFAPYQAQLDSLKTQIDLFQNDMTESEKVKAQQAFQEKQDALDFARQKQLLSYKASIDKASGVSDELLSVAEAKSLGVPYGTTKSQAIGKRFTSPTQQEAQNNANSALLALGQLTTAITNKDGTFNNKKFANLGLGKVANNVRELTDVISRIRTGAALTKEEEAFYKKQVPRLVDNDATIKQKLNNLAAFYSGISGSAITLKLSDGSTVVADDMFDAQTRTEVRQAIANGAEIISY